MIYTGYVDDVLKPLGNLLADSSFTSDMKDQYVQLLHELKHLKFYEWVQLHMYICVKKETPLVHESLLWSALRKAAKEYLLSGENYLNGFRSSDSVTSELLDLIQLCKPEIKEGCLNFLDSSFELNFSTENLLGFMDTISASLHNLLDWKDDMILDVKVKIESLKKNLDWLTKVFNVTRREEDLKDLKIHTQALAWRATCVPLLCWVPDVTKEDMEPRMDIILSDLQKKTNPSNPEVIRMYIGGLKALDPIAEETFDELVELLKDNLEVDPEKDDIRMLFNDLIILIRFLMKHQEVEELAGVKLVLEQADAVANEVASVIALLCSGEIKEGMAEERNLLLQASLEKAKATKAEVRKLYANLFLDPPSFNFPKINVLGYIDSLLENLKELSLHFQENQIIMLKEELFSLKESNLQSFSILELQNKHQEIKDLWTRIIEVAYSAERAVSFFIYMMKTSLWQNDILCLSNVIEEVKLIKGEVKRIKDQYIHDTANLNSERSPTAVLPSQANNPTANEVFVGFKNEVKKLVDQLLKGSTKLHFILISGMPGLGKTTLAKKVYTNASVQGHFHIRAWCTISQQLSRKKILLDILRDMGFPEKTLSEMDVEDLANKVYKSLKGQRYFIVMDDIWDVCAWNALQISFPDDENGSQIMFTSRIDNVISRLESSLTSFSLSLLSKEESWELLSWKLFDQGSCPSDFIEIGKQIATNCKGLPLSIVIIAGLLKENIESLNWWKQVGESLYSFITREGCGDILDLSYKHLPEYLKPCFLYFGLFKEDEEIRVKKLILLWIAEGLVQKQHQIKSLEAVAEGYLKDLVARSLVLVTKRSSTGEIKACNIHDLLRDFCISKGGEENFCKVVRENKDGNMAATYYRVGIQAPKCWNSFLEHVPPTSAVHSLLAFYYEDYERESKKLSFPYFKFLQVLNLDMFFPKFPEGITKLVHLRYLAINVAVRLLWLPPSIKRLKNLETLYLKTLYMEVELEGLNHLLEMQNLKHLYIPQCRVHDFWYNMSPLVNIRLFSSIAISSQNHLKVLRKIPKVQKLACKLNHWENPILTLDFLSHLESLYIDAHYCTFSVAISCDFQLPKTLKKLRLGNFYRLQWSEMGPIANLPNLEVLSLSNSFRGKTWNVEDGEFLQLRCLVLRLSDIEQLNASDDSFPCLEHLDIDNCLKLKSISPRFGSIPTLKMIQVKNCGARLSRSLQEIQEEQQDMGNGELEVLRAIDEISSYQEKDSSAGIKARPGTNPTCLSQLREPSHCRISRPHSKERNYLHSWQFKRDHRFP